MMKVENLVIVKDWKRESLEGNLEVKVLKKWEICYIIECEKCEGNCVRLRPP